MNPLMDGFVQSNLVAVSAGATLLSGIVVLLMFQGFSRLRWRSASISTFFSLEKWPAAAIAALGVCAVSFPFEQVTAEIMPQKILSIAIIAAVVWFFLRVVDFLQEIVFAWYPVEQADNLQERKVRTRFQYIRYILTFAILLVGIASIFLQFDSLRTLGTGLLASAGVMGIVIAFAAHQTLGNLLAGFQIAFAQPFRIDDVVIVEGEWGRIEEITFTYVVVRIWDQRRLVLPISYFITHPFQNWTRTTAEILGTVSVYVDYTVPVERVREELDRVVASTDLWDGRVAGLQVTDTTERTVTLRALVSARNASDAWDLRCLVRERLIGFLQSEYPDALPRLRVDEGAKRE
ncbi:MAG: mechanosensitive ion channel family protein [Methanomicrobiales archaeon]